MILLYFSGHKCYVCAPNTRKFSDFQELKKMFGNTKIPKCSHYHRSRRHEFIQECPKESQGCLTQFEGNVLGINICKSASPINQNNVFLCPYGTDDGFDILNTHYLAKGERGISPPLKKCMISSQKK